jgi:hypothetical protein
MTMVLLSLSLTSCEQYNNKQHLITLYVDTSQITNNTVNQFSNFGQTDGSSNENYTTTVNVGDIITWRGVSTSSDDDVVNITAIKHENGNDIFSKNRLPGNGGDPEIVVGLVLNLAPEGTEYKYKISFTVKNNGVQRNGVFHIDPKIRVDQ